MTEFDIETVAQMLLMACNEMLLVPIIIGGFLAIDRKVFGHATILLMFIMILNAFLKSIFQIPLADHLGIEGYAFPSGHMSSAFTFYGWLLINSKENLLKIILGTVIIGVGFALIYKDYHNIYDILGSVFFCTILLAAYWQSSKAKQIANRPFIMGYIAAALSGVILWYFDSFETVPNHAWMAFMVLCGFTVSWTVFAASTSSNPSILSAIIGFLCILGIYYLLVQIKIALQLPYDFQWALVGVLIPLTAKLTSGASLRR